MDRLRDKGHLLQKEPAPFGRQLVQFREVVFRQEQGIPFKILEITQDGISRFQLGDEKWIRSSPHLGQTSADETVTHAKSVRNAGQAGKRMGMRDR